jgi:hypothetical protein
VEMRVRPGRLRRGDRGGLPEHPRVGSGGLRHRLRQGAGA